MGDPIDLQMIMRPLMVLPVDFYEESQIVNGQMTMIAVKNRCVHCLGPSTDLFSSSFRVIRIQDDAFHSTDTLILSLGVRVTALSLI